MKTIRLLITVLTLTVVGFGARPAAAQTPFGNALAFDGTNQSVSVANFGNIIPTNEITVEFWAYTTTPAVQSVFMLIPDQVTNRLNGHINYLDRSAAGSIYWDFGNISRGGRVSVNAPVNSISNWVHYAFVASQSGNFMCVYANGNLLANKTGMTPFVRGNYSLQIGGPGFPYNGSVDEFRVWKTARSQAEIQQNLTAPLVGNEAGLLLYYRFNNTNGTIAANSATATGAAYNGKLTNSPAWITSDIPFLVVTNVNDSGPGSLRQTIATAANGSTIIFAPKLSGKTITLTNGELVLNKNLTIDASTLTNGLTINGNGTSRVFNVTGGATNALKALTIANGLAPAGVFAADGGGGGLFCRGRVDLLNCSVVSNAVVASSFNSFAGGIACDDGDVRLTNCTIAFNKVLGGSGESGAFYNYGGTFILDQCTVASNQAFLENGGTANGGNTLLHASIFANGNTDLKNFSGCVSLGCNLMADGTGSDLTDGVNGDQIGTAGSPLNALLAPLGNYGGLTQTMPPLAGSPAIDGCTNSTSLTTDQRGLPRVVGPFVDIGAAEFQEGSPLVVNNADSGMGSLRYAITYCPVGSTITFTNTLSGSTIVLTSGELLLNQNITIDARSLTNGIAIDGNHVSRVFHVPAGKTNVLTSLSVINGFANTNDFSGDGGGIYNSGMLTVNACTFNGNLATRFGGGIVTYGMLVVKQCTLTDNTCMDEGSSGIDTETGAATVNQVTVSGNHSGEGIGNYGGLVTLSNSIVAGNVVNLNGFITQAGVNLTTGNPMLAPLGNYGGPTQTMPPVSPSSPAINAAGATTFTTDQRGLPRVVGGRADIGAVEAQAPAATAPTVTITSPAAFQLWSNANFTVTGKAQDNVAVASVLYYLNNSDATPANNLGAWTNWSAALTLIPGTNTFTAVALDSQGNLSAAKTVRIFYVVNSTLTVAVSGPGTFSPASYSNIVLQIGKNYTLTGTPSKPGFGLKNWTDAFSHVLSTNATLQFLMTPNLALTANYWDVQKPTLSITNVPTVLNVSEAGFSIIGKATDNVAVTNVYWRVNNSSWIPAFFWTSTNASNPFTNWIAGVSLNPGTNTVDAYAIDSTGNRSLTNTVKLFYFVNSTLTVTINGPGVITPATYTNILLPIGRNFAVTGTPTKAGYVLTNWTRGSTIISNKPTLTFRMAASLALTANFIDIAKPVLTVLTPTAASAGSENFLASGKTTDNAVVTNVYYNLNSLGWFPVDFTNNYANWSVTLGLTPGTNYFSAYAIDSSGNLSLTNNLKFLYTTAPATLSGLAAEVTPDGGVAFSDAFGATTFSQASTDLNNVNAVGSYTYTKQTPSSGLLKLTYTAPPLATNEGLQTIKLAFTAPNVARYTNGIDLGGIVFTSTPTLVQPSILNQTVFVINGDGGVQTKGIAFTAGKYVSSNLVTHILQTNTGYTYTPYGPAGALLKHADTNGQSYLVFHFFGTNYGTVQWQNHTAAGVFADAKDMDFAFASQRPGGNAPTNLVGRSFVYEDTGFSRTFFLDATNATFAFAPNISGDPYFFSGNPNGTYTYNRTNLNGGNFNSSFTGSDLVPIQFIAPNFGYIDLFGNGIYSGVLFK